MKRRLPLDKRLNWRDPDMLVIRTGIIDGKQQTAEIKPKHVQQYYAIKLERANLLEPDFKNDPTL